MYVTEGYHGMEESFNLLISYRLSCKIHLLLDEPCITLTCEGTDVVSRSRFCIIPIWASLSTDSAKAEEDPQDKETVSRHCT